MKIAIASQGMDIFSRVNSRLGRSAYFIIFDSDSEEFNALENDENNEMDHGAGIGTVKMLATHGVKVVIAGNIGPKALTTLSAANIKGYLSSEESVVQALKQFKAGKLKEKSAEDQDGVGARANENVL
ncbi:MAG: NifB/NifX family molybdenum-iron cluster-binding protein [Candidatus Hinthialibacter antarcticus]|nr:NifB/NifX family molybdenum-iron cluster-binding protein [Candidatus Hinthialibacter antarcticus]